MTTATANARVEPLLTQLAYVARAGLVFHETYHVGQSGLLQRLAGREGAIK